MSTTIRVPDLGVDSAEIIEILVQPGEHVDSEQGLVMVESDKASMEIPTPEQGIIETILVNVGDVITQGQELVVLANKGIDSQQKSLPDDDAMQPETTHVPQQNVVQQKTTQSNVLAVPTPDLGVDKASIIEILVQPGEHVDSEQGLIVIESDKASMEVPSPFVGVVQSVEVNIGDEITQGDIICYVESGEGSSSNESPDGKVTDTASQSQQAKVDATSTALAQQLTHTIESPQKSQAAPSIESLQQSTKNTPIYAGPAVRKLARHLGVDLVRITPSSTNGRIVKDDIYKWVNTALQQQSSEQQSSPTNTYESAGAGGIDFSQFGSVRSESMTRLHQLTADSMVKTSSIIPQVTQFDSADITDVEAFRASIRQQAEQHGVKVTLVAFLVMASAKALRVMPKVNVSIDRHQVMYKDYCNIGLAVDTPNGLMVPVIRDADSKNLFVLAQEIADLASRARKKALKPADMQGGCFTISSLGKDGGTGFTPLVNHPEVAILGVSKSAMQPVWDGKTFVPRLLCPLALSYDHRAINGADGAQFMRLIARFLEDPRHMLL